MTIARFFKKPIFADYRLLYSLFVLLALFISIKYVFLATSNNYSIFYYALTHLRNGESMYNLYPQQYTDHYHYAPTFAAVFYPFFALPYKVGLFLWHFFFTAVWVYAVYRMPLQKKQKVFIYWYAIQELLTSIDNSQTNPLIAAIPLFAFVCFENKKPFWAAAFIMLGFNVKIYSLVTAGLFVIYPDKLKFIAYMLLWGVLYAILPILFTTPEKLYWQTELWVQQLFIKSDVDKAINQSIHRLVHQILSPTISNAAIVGMGILFFCSVYYHVKRFAEEQFKMLLLASILIFHVIFNPVAESPTYIIAVTGVAIWWLFSPQTYVDLILLVGCYFFTILSPTDFVPAFVRQQWVIPFVLKALPCVLIWFRILYIVHFTTPLIPQKAIA